MSRTASAILAIKQSSFYQRMTFVWLFIMGLCTLFWLQKEGGWEPVVTFAGILAAASGFVLEPLHQKSQERESLMSAVWQEMIRNNVQLTSLRHEADVHMFDGELVYFRLSNACLERAMASTVITLKSDKDLWCTMLIAKDQIEKFNCFAWHVESLLWQNEAADKGKLHSRIEDSQVVAGTHRTQAALKDEISKAVSLNLS